MSDSILHITLADGMVRGLLLTATETVREAAKLHQTSAVATAALGRSLMSASMLAATLKEPNASVTLTIDGDGPLGKIICIGERESVRGCLTHPSVSLPLRADGKLDVGGAVGRHGRMSVVKDLRLKSPYIGQIELVSGELAQDLAYYFVQSEQTPSLVSLGVIASDTEVSAAGGVLLQPMPGCPDAIIDALELRAPIFGDVANELRYEPMETLMDSWFDGLKPVVLERTPFAYRCHCSRERMERALISLGPDELKRMIADEVDGAELCCHFCNARYSFTTHDLLRLLNRIH